MNIEINKLFLKILVNSMNPGQINHLGEKLDSRFNIYKESGFSKSIPIPRQTAAQTLLQYFSEEEDVVELFTQMLAHDGSRFYNSVLKIWSKDDLINLLSKYKWIYDYELNRFFMDPFYEHEINFLKSVRIIDLRDTVDVDRIIKGITDISHKMGIQDLEWRITLRLYDLEPHTGELLRKIIGLLLVRQKLEAYTFEMFTCLKELVINASKANYKLLFEKYITRPQGITTENDYFHFLRLFKDEIDEHGNKRLMDLARKEDRYINITFQSTLESIAIWVTNNANISVIEKQEILKKIDEGELQNKNINKNVEEYAEGAGLGLNLILSILKKYSSDKNLLKVIFYPDFIKIGFILSRVDLLANRS